jgi:malonyl-CoA O-methyltransferase
MESRKQLVADRFGRQSEAYHGVSQVQEMMARELLDFVEIKGTPQKIAEFGVGTGHLTRRLLERWPEASFQALDIASSMLDSTRMSLGDRGDHIAWICADAEEYPWGPVDLLCSNATVQWFDNLPRFLQSLLQGNNAPQQLLFSTFGPSSLEELYSTYRHTQDRLLQAPTRFWEAEDLENLLLSLGVLSVRSETKIVRECYSTPKQALQALKQMGVTNPAQQGNGFSPSSWKNFVQYYQERYAHADGGVCLSWECVYVYCEVY